MPSYTYRVARADGTIIEERAEAADEKALRERLTREGYLVFAVKGNGRPSILSQRFLVKPRLSLREFLVFNQELTALISSGLSIMRVLDLLIERTSHPRFKEALMGVREKIKAGSSIADALSAHPRQFPELYIASLRIGEKSGNLVVALQRYTQHMKRMMAVRKKVVSAISYPLFLLLVGCAVITFLLLYVIPTFSEMYKEAESQLPLATQVLMGVVRSARASLPLLILMGAAVIISLGYWWTTDKGRARLDALFLRLPLIGRLLLTQNLINMTRTLSTLLGSGIPLVPALTMVSEATPNRAVSRKIGMVRERVMEGGSIAAAFGTIGLVPKTTLEMMSVGEATGSLEEMLNHAADFHEDELDESLARLTTWIEPVLLVIMGLVVGTIVVVMYLPIFYLAGTVH